MIIISLVIGLFFIDTSILMGIHLDLFSKRNWPPIGVSQSFRAIGSSKRGGINITVP